MPSTAFRLKLNSSVKGLICQGWCFTISFHFCNFCVRREINIRNLAKKSNFNAKKWNPHPYCDAIKKSWIPNYNSWIFKDIKHPRQAFKSSRFRIYFRWNAFVCEWNALNRQIGLELWLYSQFTTRTLNSAYQNPFD